MTDTLSEEFLGFEREACVTLFYLDASIIGVDVSYAFCNEVNPDGSIVEFDGTQYQPIPCEITGEKRDSRNQLPSPTLKIGEIYDQGMQLLIGSLLEQNNDLIGAMVQVYRVRKSNLDNGSDPNPLALLSYDTYSIRQLKKSSRIVHEFELSVGNELEGKQIPAQILTNNCSWRYYRDPGCGYTGAPVQDGYGQPLTPTAYHGAVLSDGKTLTGHDFSDVQLNSTVVADGIPLTARVAKISTDKQTLTLDKTGTNGIKARLWIVFEECPRNLINCKHHFGITYPAKVTPGSDILESVPGRGKFNKLGGAFVHSSDLNAGFPVARKVVAVLSSETYDITDLTFDEPSKSWVFDHQTGTGITANCSIQISGVHSEVDGNYVLMSDSFGGPADTFSINAKPLDVTGIDVTAALTTFTTATNHTIQTGDRVYVTATGDPAIDGFHTATRVDSLTFTVPYTSTDPYDDRGRYGYQTVDYMGNLLGTEVLNDVDAANPWGQVYFAQDLVAITGATFAVRFDRVQLDQPVAVEGVQGTYDLIWGNENVAGLLNFGGQPGAAVVNF